MKYEPVKSPISVAGNASACDGLAGSFSMKFLKDAHPEERVKNRLGGDHAGGIVRSLRGSRRSLPIRKYAAAPSTSAVPRRKGGYQIS